MSAREKLAPILEILLAAIAKECGKTQDYLSVEIEQVAQAALYEAVQIGTEIAHERPTTPPTMPAVRPVPTATFRPSKTKKP